MTNTIYATRDGKEAYYYIESSQVAKRMKMLQNEGWEPKVIK